MNGVYHMKKTQKGKNFLTNQFLIAMPSMEDHNFEGTVTYICEHNEDGAMGIIINRPMQLSLGDILEQMSIHSKLPEISNLPIFNGGPVSQEQGFILHKLSDTKWQSTLPTSSTLALTTSKDILQDIAVGNGPSQHIVSLGYAGWEAGQLEKEIQSNHWLNVPADDAIIFEQPSQNRYQAAVAKLGFDLTLLSREAGHC